MAGKTGSRGRGNDGNVTIIIRRDEGEEPAHHGGAWKVAYADFVTAMMAFFLLMWLLNATTEQQRTGLADYFAPTNLFGRAASGSGQPFGGKTPNDVGTSVSTSGSPQVTRGQQPPQLDVEDDDAEVPAQVPTPANDQQQAAEAHDGHPTQPDGRAVSSVPGGKGVQALVQGGDYVNGRITPAATPDPSAPPTTAQPGNQTGSASGNGSTAQSSNAAAAREDAARERVALQAAGQQIMDAIRRDPALQDAMAQISVQVVPEGLRIQMVDAEARPMFALGGAAPMPQVRALMQKMVPILAGLPNAISIAGHTDARMYKSQEKGNWELSAERANATRRILMDAGLADGRIRSVTGNADRDLLVPADPLNPSNRRIAVIVLRHATSKGAPTP